MSENIKLNKQVYNKNDYQKIIDTSFKQLGVQTIQQQLAQHLVGYTPRTYLNNIFSNPISQYKFYSNQVP